MNISDKVKSLKPTDLNCNVFDVYTYDGLSMQELLCQFFTKINECIKVSNETIDLASWLVNEGLRIEVVKKLMLWLEDGTLENLINVNLFNTLNTKIENINSLKTVQDLKNMSLKLDTIIQTCGYYDVNDGGANTYIVIPSKKYSYDIECKEYAIRPVATSDTVCPKQFGTVNDRVNGDNEWLQACFDFVRDYNIGVIDGRNLLYTTDSSTRTYHDHYGVVIHQPVTLRNYRGQVKDDIGHLTSVIDILQVENDFREYLIENCEFNGKYGTVARTTIGTEDGGRHCICFYAESGKFPKEYVSMGNITIRNCRFIKPDSYGIFISPADCTYTVENCTFDVNGPCILSYATTMIAKNCTATINSSYKTMVLNFLHDEMEMASNYQGNKLKSFFVDNCHTSKGFIVKTHNEPQGKLSYDKIVINNCSSPNLLEMYQTYTKEPTTINSIELYSSSGVINIEGLEVGKIITDNITNTGRFYIRSNVNIVEINNFEFKKTQSLCITRNVQNLYLNKCKALESLDAYFDGVRGSDTSIRKQIVNLYITDFEWCDSSRMIDEIGIENIYIDNLHIYGVEKTGFDFIYNHHTEGCKKFIIKNSVFEIPTADWCYLLQNQNPSTGNAIIKDCVYTGSLSMLLNGMTKKSINVVNLDDIQ